MLIYNYHIAIVPKQAKVNINLQVYHYLMTIIDIQMVNQVAIYLITQIQHTSKKNLVIHREEYIIEIYSLELFIKGSFFLFNHSKINTF